MSSTSVLQLGQVVVTAGVSEVMSTDLSFHTFVYTSLLRHEGGDWGELCESDRISNELAAVSGRRLLSVYECAASHQSHGSRLYIITEADRSVTTVLWPREY